MILQLYVAYVKYLNLRLRSEGVITSGLIWWASSTWYKVLNAQKKIAGWKCINTIMITIEMKLLMIIVIDPNNSISKAAILNLCAQSVDLCLSGENILSVLYNDISSLFLF